MLNPIGGPLPGETLTCKVLKTAPDEKIRSQLKDENSAKELYGFYAVTTNDVPITHGTWDQSISTFNSDTTSNPDAIPIAYNGWVKSTAGTIVDMNWIYLDR